MWALGGAGFSFKMLLGFFFSFFQNANQNSPLSYVGSAQLPSVMEVSQKNWLEILGI